MPVVVAVDDVVRAFNLDMSNVKNGVLGHPLLYFMFCLPSDLLAVTLSI